MCKKDVDICNINLKFIFVFGGFLVWNLGKKDRIRRDKVVFGIYVWRCVIKDCMNIGFYENVEIRKILNFCFFNGMWYLKIVKSLGWYLVNVILFGICFIFCWIVIILCCCYFFFIMIIIVV